MKNTATLFLMLFASHFCIAQNPNIKRTNHWYFGWNAGLDFSNDTVVPDTNGAYNNDEATATISDTAGNLLFYTDAETVWNRNHQIMQYGYDIGGCWSSTQGALIVPIPDNDSIYYIFTTDCSENNLVNGLRYSIVNMNLDSGRGAIEKKNILLHTPVAEKLAGVHHANKKDIWVVTHEWNTNKFFAYLITNNGVDTTSRVSSVGSVHTGLNSHGYLKFSPNGEKIISLQTESSIIELFDFNDSIGIVSNAITLPAAYTFSYGTSFSSNSSRLYISYAGGTGQSGKLFQYDLMAGNVQDIINSKVLVFVSSSYQFYALQNGTDGKIYISTAFPTTNLGYALGLINKPNKLGNNCDFSENNISLSGKICRFGLPNFIETYFNCDTCKVQTSTNSENIFVENDISIYPNPAGKFINISASQPIEKVSIYNLLGKMIYSRSYIHSTNNVSIVTDNFEEGIYFINISNLQQQIIKRLIIVHNQF